MCVLTFRCRLVRVALIIQHRADSRAVGRRPGCRRDGASSSTFGGGTSVFLVDDGRGGRGGAFLWKWTAAPVGAALRRRLVGGPRSRVSKHQRGPRAPHPPRTPRPPPLHHAASSCRRRTWPSWTPWATSSQAGVVSSPSFFLWEKRDMGLIAWVSAQLLPWPGRRRQRALELIKLRQYSDSSANRNSPL